jgi:diacylglycerol kinase family enzyme
VKGFLLVNPRSGKGGPSPEELVAEARARGHEARVLGDGDDAAELARAADAEALGIAGGDGSLALVADVALERGLPFVCVPFGTRNHFARDLGLDRDDPLAALAAFEGVERRVDVGRVGERLFLNNVSLGVYARLVHRRERHRRRREALARLRALLALLRRGDRVSVAVNGETVSARVVLVANNHYDLRLLSLGERARLDEGLLHLYAPQGPLPVLEPARAAARRGGRRAGRARDAVRGADRAGGATRARAGAAARGLAPRRRSRTPARPAAAARRRRTSAARPRRRPAPAPRPPPAPSRRG